MAEDLEVGVLLEPKNNLEEDVGPVSVGQEGEDGGGLTAGQQQQQEGVVAGGVSKAVAGAAVLAGILTQVESVVGIVQAVFGVISRSLVPIIEEVAEFIRPLVSGVNDLISQPEQAVQNVQTSIQENPAGFAASLPLGLAGLTNFAGGGTNELSGVDDQIQSGLESIGEFLDFGGPSSADQTGEATKQQFKQNVEEAKRDKTGASK